jgi:hypothetical protein
MVIAIQLLEAILSGIQKSTAMVLRLTAIKNLLNTNFRKISSK